MKYLIKNSKRIVFVFIIIFLLIIIGLTTKERENVSSTENVIGIIVSRGQKAIFNVGQTFDNAFVSIQSISKLKEENKLLRNEISELKEKNRILNDIVNNSIFLESEYRLRMNLKHDYVEAQVISKDSSNWFDKFVIDKGTREGLKKNDIVVQAVVSDGDIVQTGLVGRVIEVGYNWSKVVAMLDENSNISFRLIENNESGMIKGNLDGIISGYFFNNHSVANIGDKLVTSGLGEIYIPDIFIGTVNEIKNTNDAKTFEINVEPAVDFSKLYKVFVLKVNR